MNKKSILDLSIAAIACAFVYVFTWLVNIRLPFGGNGGIIHLGNLPLFIFAIVFGRKIGAIAGAVGMALFDITSGWGTWAPFTFVIVGLMGYVVGLITKDKHSIVRIVIGIILAIVIKIVGYYFAEVILYGDWIVPFSSIPGNIIQVGFAGVITVIVIKPIDIEAQKIIHKNVDKVVFEEDSNTQTLTEGK